MICTPHYALFAITILLSSHLALSAIHKRATHHVLGETAAANPLSVNELELPQPFAIVAVAEDAPFRNQQDAAAPPDSFSADEIQPKADRLQYLEDAPLSVPLLQKAAADLWSSLVEVKLLVESTADMPIDTREEYTQNIADALQIASSISDDLALIDDEQTVESANIMQQMLAAVKAGYGVEDEIRADMKQGFAHKPTAAAPQTDSSWAAPDDTAESIAIDEPVHRLQEIPSLDAGLETSLPNVPVEPISSEATSDFTKPLAAEQADQSPDGTDDIDETPMEDEYIWDDIGEDYEDDDEDEFENIPEEDASPPVNPGSGLLAGDGGVSLVQEEELQDTIVEATNDAINPPSQEVKDTAEEGSDKLKEVQNDIASSGQNLSILVALGLLILFFQ